MRTVIPESILMFESERGAGYYHYEDSLDYDYIDIAANAIAHTLRSRLVPAEIAYEPGDGTFYGLVFVPLVGLVAAPPRMVDGLLWERHAVRGMTINDGDHYGRDGFLVCWIDHASYPLRLANRGHDLAASYVREHWDTSYGSAGSLVLLFRAIAFHLERHDKESA